MLANPAPRAAWAFDKPSSSDDGESPNGPFALASARPGRDELAGMGTKSCRYSVRSDAQNPSGSLRGRMPQTGRRIGVRAHRSGQLPFGHLSRAAQQRHPHLTSHLTSFTPHPLASQPRRSNRQTAARGTGESFRFCSKSTVCRAVTIRCSLIKFFFLSFSKDVFFAWLGRADSPASQPASQPGTSTRRGGFGLGTSQQTLPWATPHDAFHALSVLPSQ